MSYGARRAVGAVVILAYLTAYVIVAVAVGSHLAGAPWFVQLPFYAIAGVCWALPLKPLFSWMGRRS
ncbi:MAG TPA: DUF2842 domain-containing protein [Caulobacterales bacterium]|jgi:hypothetical protein|nr:DUF2842 domain-containing protein [Caulobacterales bacterium]